MAIVHSHHLTYWRVVWILPAPGQFVLPRPPESCRLFCSSMVCAYLWLEDCTKDTLLLALCSVFPFLQGGCWFLHVFPVTYAVPQHCCAREGYGFACFALAFSWSWVISQEDPSNRTVVLFNAQHLKPSHKGRLHCDTLVHNKYCDIPKYCLRASIASCCQWTGSVQAEPIQVFISLPGLSRLARRVVNLSHQILHRDA